MLDQIKELVLSDDINNIILGFELAATFAPDWLLMLDKEAAKMLMDRQVLGKDELFLMKYEQYAMKQGIKRLGISISIVSSRIKIERRNLKDIWGFYYEYRYTIDAYYGNRSQPTHDGKNLRVRIYEVMGKDHQIAIDLLKEIQ